MSIRSHASNGYDPIYVADANAEFATNGRTPATVDAYNPPRFSNPFFVSGPFYNQHVGGEDDVTPAEGGELLSPPSYDESTRAAAVNSR